jgi:hypothetical protein
MVDEDTWRAATNPRAMFELIQSKWTDRKLRLFGCGCCRAMWSVLGDESRRVIETAERYADGVASPEEINRAATRANRSLIELDELDAGEFTSNKHYYGALAVETTISVLLSPPTIEGVRNLGEWLPDGARTKAELLRDLFGNPFHSVSVDPQWRTAAVVGIAQGIYRSGDFSALPVLADALEEAGCADEEILSHCRLPGRHVRGCWVIDAVLGEQGLSTVWPTEPSSSGQRSAEVARAVAAQRVRLDTIRAEEADQRGGRTFLSFMLFAPGYLGLVLSFMMTIIATEELPRALHSSPEPRRISCEQLRDHGPDSAYITLTHFASRPEGQVVQNYGSGPLHVLMPLAPRTAETRRPEDVCLIAQFHVLHPSEVTAHLSKGELTGSLMSRGSPQLSSALQQANPGIDLEQCWRFHPGRAPWSVQGAGSLAIASMLVFGCLVVLAVHFRGRTFPRLMFGSIEATPVFQMIRGWQLQRWLPPMAPCRLLALIGLISLASAVCCMEAGGLHSIEGSNAIFFIGSGLLNASSALLCVSAYLRLAAARPQIEGA